MSKVTMNQTAFLPLLFTAGLSGVNLSVMARILGTWDLHYLVQRYRTVQNYNRLRTLMRDKNSNRGSRRCAVY